MAGKERMRENKRERMDDKKRRSKSRFEELLKTNDANKMTWEEDLELERGLAKKLKVRKDGKLPGDDDDLLNTLLGLSDDEDDDYGIFREEEPRPDADNSLEQGGEAVESDDELSEEEEFGEEDGEAEEPEYDDDGEAESQEESEEDYEEIVAVGGAELGSIDYQRNSARVLAKENDDEGHPSSTEGAAPGDDEPEVKKPKNSDKYLAPHLRKFMDGDKSESQVRLERQVRGLLNRLAESNVESVAKEVGQVFQESGRSAVGSIIADEILSACISGPKSNDQSAAVFAAFLAGTAASAGEDFGANFVSVLAQKFEEQYKEDDSLAVQNLTRLLAYLHSFDLVSSGVLYSFLDSLCARFEEMDVSAMLTLLQGLWMSAMVCAAREAQSCPCFVAVSGMGLRKEDPQTMKDFILSVQRKSSLQGQAEGQEESGFSMRVKFMLETIVDIKNNRKKSSQVPQFSRLKKWLQNLPVEEVQLRNASWSLLTNPAKKGRWWLPQAAASLPAGAAVADVDGDGAQAPAHLLQLAAAQRMNTDVRRAVFCVVMNAQDYVDASEKLLRMKLKGKQDREMLRVVLECCLQERAYNPYYALLAVKLCSQDKNHKFTLQYLLWDHHKELGSMELRRSANLARLSAHVIGSHSLSLACLKTVDFGNPRALTAKLAVHFRILFEALLLGFPREVVWAVFSRLACAPPALSPLRDGLALFLLHHVRLHSVTVAETQGEVKGKQLVKMCKLAGKALGNTAGTLFK